MRRRAAATGIVILAGLAGLLRYTLLQMAIVSDLHRSRQLTRLNFLVSMYSLRNNQTRKKSITTCSNKLISSSDHVKFLSAAMFDLGVLHQLQHDWLKTLAITNHNRDVKSHSNAATNVKLARILVNTTAI